MKDRLNVVAFASGGGSNFQTLLDRASTSTEWRIAGLITNKPTAGALERAMGSGVDTLVIPTKDRPEEEVAAETLAALEQWDTDLICLAGYMRLLPPQVVARFRRRILNVHPALLPAFGGQGMYGMNVHRAVVVAGERWSGPTVHYVDERYDEGEIIGQLRVPVRSDDTPETLQARVLSAEHQLYPAVVDHICAALRRGVEPGPLQAAGEESPTFTEEMS